MISQTAEKVETQIFKTHRVSISTTIQRLLLIILHILGYLAKFCLKPKQNVLRTHVSELREFYLSHTQINILLKHL